MKNLKNKLKNEIYQWKIYDRNEKLIPFTDDMIPENAVGFIYIINMLKDDKRYGYIGKKNFYSKRKKRLIKICFSKTELTYQETKAQFQHEVLERDNWLNGNILGRFYKGKI